VLLDRKNNSIIKYLSLCRISNLATDVAVPAGAFLIEREEAKAASVLLLLVVVELSVERKPRGEEATHVTKGMTRDLIIAVLQKRVYLLGSGLVAMKTGWPMDMVGSVPCGMYIIGCIGAIVE